MPIDSLESKNAASGYLLIFIFQWLGLKWYEHMGHTSPLERDMLFPYRWMMRVVYCVWLLKFLSKILWSNL